MLPLVCVQCLGKLGVVFILPGNVGVLQGQVVGDDGVVEGEVPCGERWPAVVGETVHE